MCKRTGFVHQELRDFVKMTLFSSHWLWLESSHSVKNVTRVESPFFSTWLESSPSHQKSWLEPSRVIDTSHAVIACCVYLTSNQKVLIYTTPIKKVIVKLYSFILRNKITEKQDWDRNFAEVRYFTSHRSRKIAFIKSKISLMGWCSDWYHCYFSLVVLDCERFSVDC